MAKLLIIFIKLYRILISPLSHGCCRYQPTCSQYSVDAIKSHGCVKGFILMIKRISRCHPWSNSGYDPVPEILENFKK